MRFAVLGAGAIGAYLGAALARGGADVVLIARGPHLAAMQQHGVRVVSERGDFTSRVEAVDDYAAVADADVVFVGLKATSLPEELPRIAPMMRDDAALIPLQNGVPWWFFQSFGGPLAGTVIESVDPAGVITDAIDASRVIGCVTFPAAEIIEPGVVKHLEGTRFVLGEPGGAKSDRCRAIAGALVAGGLKAPVDAHIRQQLWLKLIGNVAFNTVSTITGATLRELGAEPAMRRLLLAVMQEVTDVGEALGIQLPVSIERRLEGGVAVGDHKTSMLQDLEAGKPLELGCMSGAVLEIAAKLELPVPHVETLHACALTLAARRDRRAEPRTAP